MSAQNTFIDVQRCLTEADQPGLAIKIQTEFYELNVVLETSEIEQLAKVRAADWSRGSVRAGLSAGSAVFWSCDGKSTFIAVGYDDETWDFGVTLPLAAFDEIMAGLVEA